MYIQIRKIWYVNLTVISSIYYTLERNNNIRMRCFFVYRYMLSERVFMRTWFHPAPDHAKRVVRCSANISCWNPYSDFPRMVENNIAKYISQLRRQLEIYSRSYDSKGYGIGLVADSPTRILQRSPKLVCNVDTASPWFRDLFSSHVTSECNRNAWTWSRCTVMVNVRYAPYFEK